MKNSVIMLSAVVLGLGLLGGVADAATFRIDLNGQSGPNETGYTSWNFADGFSGALNASSSFAYTDATDGTLDVNLSTTTTAGSRNYGIDNVDQSGGSLSIPNVWGDLVFWNNNTAGSMTLTLDDLTAGPYQFTSYSYADNVAGNPGEGDSGIADVSVDTGSGFVDTGLNVTMGAHRPSLTTAQLESICTVSVRFTVANDNDTIKILYNGLAGNGGDSFGINGFEIASLTGIESPPKKGTLISIR